MQRVPEVVWRNVLRRCQNRSTNTRIIAVAHLRRFKLLLLPVLLLCQSLSTRCRHRRNNIMKCLLIFTQLQLVSMHIGLTSDAATALPFLVASFDEACLYLGVQQRRRQQQQLLTAAAAPSVAAHLDTPCKI